MNKKYCLIKTSSSYCADIEIDKEETVSVNIERTNEMTMPMFQFKLRDTWLSREEALKLFSSLAEIIEHEI